ncbi:signal recognition particle-docking protein FtsY [archaeon]|nr:signal recognition particle-docking protein FtsY [archaeon]
MFGKLKEKLKSALNVFSTKTEEEADDIPQEEVDKVLEDAGVAKEVEEKEEAVEEVKEEEKVEERESISKDEESTEKEEVVEKKEEVEEKDDLVQEEEKEEPQPEVIEDTESKDSDSSPKPAEKEIDEEEAHKIIEDANKSEPFIADDESEEKEDIPTSTQLVEEAKKHYAKEEEERKARKEEQKAHFAENIVDEVVAEETKVVEEAVVEEKKEEPDVIVSEDSESSTEPEEKKGFFSKLFSRKKKEEVAEEKEDVISEEKEKPIVEEEKSVEKEVVEEKEPVTEEKIKEPVTEPKEEVQEEKGFFSKIKQSLTTKTINEDKFNDLFWELELVLLENNVSVEVIEKIKEDLKEELVGKPLPRDILAKINEVLKRTLTEILTHDPINLLEKANDKKPLIIAVFGINGAGKTTTIAKLTNYFKQHGKSVVLAACDTFRAAAIQQLEEHANKLDVKMIKHDYGSDAAAVAFDAVKHAEKEQLDVVLIDTAGRLHSNTNLMAELEKLIRVTNPDLKLFVGESITGNDCVEQARKFNELVEMDGAILTKADVDEKGGAPLSISYVIKKPILFLGVGQNYEDLEVFDRDVMLTRLGF